MVDPIKGCTEINRHDPSLLLTLQCTLQCMGQGLNVTSQASIVTSHASKVTNQDFIVPSPASIVTSNVSILTIVRLAKQPIRLATLQARREL